jgi:hypothetical protein
MERLTRTLKARVLIAGAAAADGGLSAFTGGLNLA